MQGGLDVKTPDTHRKAGTGKRFGSDYGPEESRPAEGEPEEKRRQGLHPASPKGLWQPCAPVNKYGSKDGNPRAFEQLVHSGFITPYDKNKGSFESEDRSVQEDKVLYMFVVTKGSNLCDMHARTEKTVVL